MESPVDQRVDAARLAAEGFGTDQPLEPNEDEKARASHRRVEFAILE